jgi:hypothetical protein
MLEGYLEWQRTNLLNICAGLTGVQLATRALPSSRRSLLGIVRHMAKVERIWFRQRVGREDVDALHGPPLVLHFLRIRHRCSTKERLGGRVSVRDGI